MPSVVLLPSSLTTVEMACWFDAFAPLSAYSECCFAAKPPYPPLHLTHNGIVGEPFCFAILASAWFRCLSEPYPGLASHSHRLDGAPCLASSLGLPLS
jgi:hypothetical protein